MVLDASVKEDVIFTCRAETVESSEEAVDVAANPYCQSIQDTVVERPYSNITDTEGKGHGFHCGVHCDQNNDC